MYFSHAFDVQYIHTPDDGNDAETWSVYDLLT
jgi:hypothetical protein